MNTESDKQLLNLQELFSARYKRSFTVEEIQQACVGIVHDGIVNKGWSLNGFKLKEES